MTQEYRLAPIDIEANYDNCLTFRRDSYAQSFGNTSGLEADMRDYRQRLMDKLQQLPQGNCHLWYNHQIIGQTEMKLLADPNIGYVSLFYLIPEYRAQGIGRLLHEHAVKVFQELGKTTIQLSVGQSNDAALAFYAKHGWENLGTHPGKAGRFLMGYCL